MGKIRLFVSLNFDSRLKNRLKLIQDDVKLAFKGYPVKWENYEKFHLTIRFLGDVGEDEVNSMILEFNKIKPGFNNIKFAALGIGFFPNQKYPNVVYLDLLEENNNSTRLVELIDDVIKLRGITPDKKFVPHITLGRFRRDNRKKITDRINMNFEKFEIEFKAFYLMKSILKPYGSEYEILKEFPFKN